MEGEAAAALIRVAIENLINISKKEISLIRGLKKNSEELGESLETVQKFLNDAETRAIPGGAVKSWLRKLEDLVFEADNVLDELHYHHLSDKIKRPAKVKALTSCFSSLHHYKRRRRMARRVAEINDKLKSINDKATGLGLVAGFANAPTLPRVSQETDSFSSDPVFVGREEELVGLVDVLVDATAELECRIFSLLAIQGMGGMGKTTLAAKVFNHEKIMSRFGQKSRIWVHVSRDFDPVVLLKKILENLTSSKVQVESREVVLEKLHESLKHKTYLLVLDDVWNEDKEAWENFMNSLSGVTSTKGNGILVTTRSEKVASLVRPLGILPLQGLSKEECWSIIKVRAFDKGDDPSEFETIGGNVARKCHGLPLAANVVGGVLYKASQQKWDSIGHNWLLEDERQSITEILRLSYNNLALPSLKKCFAYCSIFKKGSITVKQDMIEMWMAEGFLQPKGGNDMEAMGAIFVNILVQNSLLQVLWRYEDGDVEGCWMHDLVHDLASQVLEPSYNADGINLVRYSRHELTLDHPKEEAKHLRTLVLEGDRPGNATLSDFESLRVLTLVGYNVRELPNSVKTLIHLRLLDISTTSIMCLPDWVGEFHHLQTLRADNMHSLEKLPSTLKYLINLRHLYIDDDVELPPEIGKLTCLQTLEHFAVGDDKGRGIEELGSLKNLKGRLEIHNLEKVHDEKEAERAMLSEKPNITELHLKWDEGREGLLTNDKSVLEGLQPHPNLTEIGIYGFKSKRFASWIEKMGVRDGPRGSWVGLNKLMEVTLWECDQCVEIPMLGHLPNLKALYLRGLKKVSFINSPFRNLTLLIFERLEGLQCLPDWLFINNPNLSRLDISGCIRLQGLPDGLHALNSLEELSIRDCPNRKSIMGENNTSTGGGEGGRVGNLCSLSIAGCRELMELPLGMVESWGPSLKYLTLEELSSLKNLPMVIDCLAKSATRIRNVRLFGVPNLMVTPTTSSSVETCWDLGSLEDLSIDVSEDWSKEKSDAIKEGVDGILQGCRGSLTRLNFRGVQDWEWVPEPIQHLTALSYLTLENSGIQKLADWVGNLASLEELSLDNCGNLKILPSSEILERLTKLKRLSFNSCPELRMDSEWRNSIHQLRIRPLSVYVNNKWVHY